MDYFRILKRAAEITWAHKSTWLFGFLAALFQGGGTQLNYNINSEDLDPEMLSRLRTIIETGLTPFIIAIAIMVVLVSVAVSIFVGFLARAALIGMVRDVEQVGSTDINKGFRCGWSHWLHLLGINLSIWVPLSVFAVMVAFMLFSPAIIGFMLKQNILAILFLIVAIILLLLLIIPTVMGLSVIELVSERFRVVKKMGVLESISAGYQLIRSNLGAVFVFWLIMLLVGAALGLVLIPLTLLLLAPAIALIFINTLLGLALSIPAALVILFLSGLLQVFTSAAWTEFFLEVNEEEKAL